MKREEILADLFCDSHRVSQSLFLKLFTFELTLQLVNSIKKSDSPGKDLNR